MSKLDDIISNKYNVTYHQLTGEEQIKLWVTFQPKVKQQIKDLILELLDANRYPDRVATDENNEFLISYYDIKHEIEKL